MTAGKCSEVLWLVKTFRLERKIISLVAKRRTEELTRPRSRESVSIVEC